MTKIKKSLNMAYNSVHNFDKYSVSSFNEISSADSKFDTINKLYEDLLKLNDLKSQNNNAKRKKVTVLKNAAQLYNKWIGMYKKKYEQVFETKNADWRKQHDYKNLKNFSYQIDEVKKDKAEKEDETDQELPPWINVTKSRFNEIRDVITKANDSKLMTRLETKKKYTGKCRKVIRRHNQWKD